MHNIPSAINYYLPSFLTRIGYLIWGGKRASPCNKS